MGIRRWRQRRSRQFPWSLMLAVIGLYTIAGLVLASFLSPYWVWPLALVGTLLQALGLAGSRSLAGLQPGQIRRAVRLACLGTGTLAVALAVAANYAGTAQLEQAGLEEIGLMIGLTNLGVILLVAAAAVAGTQMGDCLVETLSRWQSAWLLAGFSALGLLMGGLAGLLLVSEARLI